MKNIEKYVKERDEMLMKGSVAELKKFIAKYEEYYNPTVVMHLKGQKMKCLK